MTVNERPVPYPVDEVGGDEREGDRADALDSLKVPAEGSVEEQRQSAPVEHAQVLRGLRADRGIRAEVWKDQRRGPEKDHEKGREDKREVDALREPAMALVEVAASIGLRDERVETEEDAYAEERGRVIDGVAHADGADGFGAETAHHDGVHDRHGHPSKLRENDWDGEREQRTQFALPLYLFSVDGHPASVANAGVDR